MYRPELITEFERDITPDDGVQIILGSCIADRVKAVDFSIIEFEAWTRERSFPNTQNHSLRINVLDRSPHDTDPTGPVTNGSFYVEARQPFVNLYIGHRLEYFDRLRDEFDVATRERAFNRAVNAALAHELEHYVETSNGNLLYGVKLEYILQGLIDFSLNPYDTTQKTDDQLRAEILSLSEGYSSAKTFDLYLAQPHEIRAREASRRYLLGNACMLNLSLNPLAEPGKSGQ